MSPERQQTLLHALGLVEQDTLVHVIPLPAGQRPISIGELREAIAQRLPHTKLTTVSRDTIEHWLGGLADCSCWFRGFEAAKGDEAGSLMPPGWRILTEISLTLKSHLAATGDANEREVDLPF